MTSEQDREDTTDGALARRLAIGAALLAIVLVAVFALNSEEPDPDSQAGNTATTVHIDDEETDTRTPDAPPVQDFEWTASALPDSDGLWVQVIGLTGDSEKLRVFGRATDPTASSPDDSDRLLVWESSGLGAWELAGSASGIPAGAEVEDILFDDGTFIAIGVKPNPDHPRRTLPLVLNSDNGLDWSEAELPAADLADTEVWPGHLAAGNKGIVVAMTLSSGHTEPELTLEKDGMLLVADADDWRLTITSETGELLFEGTPEQIWSDGGESEFGLEIRDPETRESLFSLSWERLDADPDEVTDEGTRVYVVDQYRLSIDEFSGEYSVEDVSTGETLFGGSVDDLFRGPPPVFIDANGEVLISLTWDEVDRAMEAAWRDFEEGEEEYFSRPLVLHSANGKTFDEISLGGSVNSPEVHINSLAATQDGFIALGEAWSASGEPRRLAWKSDDGINWETYQPSGESPWIDSMTVLNDHFLALGESHEGGSSVLRSSDALAWERVMEPDGSDGYTWLSRIEAGPAGVLVLGEVEGDFEGHDAYEVEANGLLLIVEPGFLYIVDTQSQQILIEGDVETLTAEGLAQIEGETITFVDSEGRTLMEQDWHEIAGHLEQENDPGEGEDYEVQTRLWFSTDGEAFFALQIDELNGVYVSSMLMGQDVIVLAGEQMGIEEFHGSDDVATTEAATDSGGLYHVDTGPEGIPTPVVVVGQLPDR